MSYNEILFVIKRNEVLTTATTWMNPKRMVCEKNLFTEGHKLKDPIYMEYKE